LQQLVFTALSAVLLWVGVHLAAARFPAWPVAPIALPLAMAMIFFQLQDFIRRYFFALNRMSVAFWNDAISYLGQVLGLILCAQLIGLDAVKGFWISALSSLVAVAFGVPAFGRVVFRWAVYRDVAQRHWHFSKWLTASAVLYWASSNLFIIVASNRFGPMAAGAIRACQNIVAVTHVLFQGLSNRVPVTAARIFHRDGFDSLRKYLWKITLWGGIVTGLLVLLAAMFPEFWLRLFYGTEYLDYGYLLQWWTASYFLIYFGVPLTVGLRTLECTRPIFVAYCVMSGFALLLSTPMINYYGLHGAMAGIFFSQVIFLWVLASALRMKMKILFVNQ